MIRNKVNDRNRIIKLVRGLRKSMHQQEFIRDKLSERFGLISNRRMVSIINLIDKNTYTISRIITEYGEKK